MLHRELDVGVRDRGGHEVHRRPGERDHGAGILRVQPALDVIRMAARRGRVCVVDDDPEPVDSLLAAVARIPPRDPAGPVANWTPPLELDEYRLIRSLGRGGMGSVWLAEDRLLDRLVALKFIAHAEPDKRTRERFAIEARAAARLQHLNVVTVYRYGEVAGRPYLVSEYIRGQSLDKLAKPVSWERSLELGIALARGLAAAHRHGIVHRDIKPANAILTADGDAKLVDFGLAKLDGARDSIAQGQLARDPAFVLTDPGGVAGTPRYLAPEVRRGEPASRRSDVYQIGCILYELVTGRPPIMDLLGGLESTADADAPSTGAPGDRRRILSRGELDAEVPSLAERLAGPGARFGAVVDACLRRQPIERYASGDELREALEQLRAPELGGDLPEGNPYRGLVAFDAEHRALFFGRGADIRSVIERLKTDAFVLVTGDSGVGKSSLCRAGVLPQFTEGAQDDLTWTVVQLVPGHRPLAMLASVLAERLRLDETWLAKLLRDEPAELTRELRRTGRGVVVFVDQLEEVSTIAERSEAQLFARVLAEFATGMPGVRLLATVRSDFLTRVAELPAIGAEIARAIYLLRPLSAESARDAVVGPARAKGASFDSEELVATLVASVAEQPSGTADGTATPARLVIELPLLAFTLAQLWEARDPVTQMISARSLDTIGGVRGALARHADGVLDGLLPQQRAAARKILLRLVTAERTRIRRSADELAAFSRPALDALVRGRLVVARGSDTPTFELAHERLIDGWPTLSAWLSETTERVAAHVRLAAAVADWARLGRTPEGLWGVRQLADLELLAHEDLAPGELDFARASRRAVRRRRLSRISIAIAVPAIVLAFYAGARLVARRDLERRVAANVAEAERLLGRAREESAASAELRTTAFARFDAGDAEHGEADWAAARRRSGYAQAGYAQAARSLEAAYLTERDDIRRALGDLTFERLQLAEREHRFAERSELATRLERYDTSGALAARLTAPARVSFSIEPASAAVSVIAADSAAEVPLAAPTTTLPGGSYVLVARAAGRATVRLPVLLGAGEDRHVAFELPRAAAVPAGFFYIPPGTFLYGSEDDDAIRGFYGTAPIHEAQTGAFMISRTEVTYAQWIEFLDALPADERARRAPHVETSATPEQGGAVGLRRLAGGVWELHIAPSTVQYTARAGEPIEYAQRATRRRQDWRQFPVAGISPEDAEAYAEWLRRGDRVPHARLCTELEWERASRGADARRFPHGDRLAADDANIDATYGRADGGFGPDEVGSHLASTSPFGLVDTAGNVFEICRAISGTGYTMRGGCYYMSTRSSSVMNGQPLPTTYRHLHVGLRMCADAP